MTILRLVFSQRSANKPVRTPLRNLCENPLRTFARNNPFLCEKNLREPIPSFTKNNSQLREPLRETFAFLCENLAKHLCEPLRETFPIHCEKQFPPSRETIPFITNPEVKYLSRLCMKNSLQIIHYPFY